LSEKTKNSLSASSELPIEHCGRLLYATMSHQQAFDSFGTPARNRQNWPSPGACHYPKAILKWRDLSTGVFKILDRFERSESRYFQKGLIVKLESFSGPILFVWAHGSLILALEQEKDAKFVENLGLKVHADGYQYFDFKLC